MIPDIEFHSQTWKSLERWALDALDLHRYQLETSGITPAQSDELRGRIAMLREFLALSSSRSLMDTVTTQPSRAGY